ncbi:MAG: capsular polysaccharide biosynthesis protein [Pseudomonadota bacterium]
MSRNPHRLDAAPEKKRRLFVFNGGFLTQKRTRRILDLSGYDIRLGVPGPDDLVGVWGNSPTSARGESVATRRNANLLRVEDAWLRSLFPGRDGTPPIGLVIDASGVHYDPSKPSDLETLLATHPLDDTALLDRARGGVERLKEAHLTKYTAFDPSRAAPAPGYVLVVDQTEGDASVKACGADRNRFLEMLFVAQEEHPGAPILIKTHPETIRGHRKGYFDEGDASDRVSFCTETVSPWTLLEGAVAVYTVSSQLGFEAIFAGHKPRVFGAPFYAGWGLTEDAFPVERRQRNLSRAQLFAAAVLLYPKWYDPFADALCAFESALETLAAETRAWREDHRGWVGSGMRLWKRDTLQKSFGTHKPMLFEDDPARARTSNRRWMVWASKATFGQRDAVRLEDGFLRSRGLGAELVPPLSLVLDDMGIYYDAQNPNRLEQWITARATLRPDQRLRADALVRRITGDGLTKYNLSGKRPELPRGHRILVVGQVEDDASLVYGGGQIRTNAALLERTRQENPHATLIYKPHPDVEAGLRDGGAVPEQIADLVAHEADPSYLLGEVQEVWTMTSLLGFEALIRGVPVTTLGVPFYAGWGLTRDLAVIPPRRRAEPDLAGLVHACLIDYPRYFHPENQTPCPVEAVVDWLAHNPQPARGTWSNRLLAKLQGVFASKAHLWR